VRDRVFKSHITVCWLPQLDAIALRIHDPGEAPVLVVLAAGIDGDTLLFQFLEQRVQIVDTIVDHEPGAAGVELIFRVAWEYRPHRQAIVRSMVARRIILLGIIDLAPIEQSARAV
jgi:hypothetical protein